MSKLFKKEVKLLTHSAYDVVSCTLKTLRLLSFPSCLLFLQTFSGPEDILPMRRWRGGLIEYSSNPALTWLKARGRLEC